MKLSTLAILLGTGFCLLQILSLWNPGKFRELARKFPRSDAWGYGLMLLGTLWFLWNLKSESISDFAAYKTLMLVGFGAVGVLACIYLRDYLAVRGLAIVMLLLAKVMLDSARWEDTSWRLIIVVWAYALVIAGMWFTISPWRLRDLIQWATETEQRIRLFGSLRLAFGLLVLVLGLTAYRAAEQRVESEMQSNLQASAPSLTLTA